MAEKWRNGLVVFFVLAVSTDAARAQEANLWGVDGLTKIMLDMPLPSAPKPADMEGARGETVSGQVVFRATRGLKSVCAETTDLKNGDHSVSAACVRLQWVRYLEVKRNSAGVPADELVARAPCSLPDRLPRGLVRSTSQEQLAAGPQRVLRPRLVIYSAILAVAFGAIAFSLGDQESADVTLLRGLGAPFQVLPGGEVSNQLRIKIANRSGADRSYSFEIAEPAGLTMIAPENPLGVGAGDDQMTAAFVNAPPSAFTTGELKIVLRVHDGVDFDRSFEYRLLGPAGPP